MRDSRTFAFEKILRDIRRLAAQVPPQYRIARALLEAGYGEAEIGPALRAYPDIPEKLRLALEIEERATACQAGNGIWSPDCAASKIKSPAPRATLDARPLR